MKPTPSVLLALLFATPLLTVAAEPEGQYLQMGLFQQNYVGWQLNLLTKERCVAGIRAMLANPDLVKSGAGEAFRCSAESAADRLEFHGEIRNIASGRVYQVDAHFLEYCTQAMSAVPINTQPPQLEIISQCAPK